MLWTVLYSLDFLAILTFAISYYRNCYRRGYRIDLWHYGLFTVCIIPNMLMLPFARNELNGVVLGQDYAAVMAALPAVQIVRLTQVHEIVALRRGRGLTPTPSS
jgi:hypothetical protein